MTFAQGLLAARSHIAFLIGLGVAVLIAWRVESLTKAEAAPVAVLNHQTAVAISQGDIPPLRETGRALSEDERQWAQVAWRYFENNHQMDTGFVNSVDGYPSTTLWDLASYMMALIAADSLHIIPRETFNARVDTLLTSLARLPLVEGIAPNKAYNTKTLKMVDYTNVEVPLGVGWSALDVARIGVPISLLVWLHPSYTDRLRGILGTWHLEQLVSEGQFVGAHRTPDGKLERVQEGRFGYEQYAAKSFFLLGHDVTRAMRYDLDVGVASVSGQPIAFDSRLPSKHGGTHNAVVSEPYILEAIEFGLTDTTRPLTRALYAAQRARFAETKQITAVSEDNIDRPPYFLYGSLFNDMKPWSTFAPNGKSYDDLRSVSLKAAIGFAYIFSDQYSTQLLQYVEKAFDPEKGWYSGRYEKDGSVNKAITANTNGIVLEILLYRTRGPILPSVMRAQTL